MPYEANPIIPLGDARNTCDGYAPESAVRTVAAIAPVAGAEWKRYYDDVTWDPDEAKRRTKDDPTKPEVELWPVAAATVPSINVPIRRAA